MVTHDPFINSRRHKIIIWSTALAIIAIGVYLSRARFLGYEWLSRSGCAVVILGIWSGLGSMIQERLLAGRLQWRRRNAIIRATAALEEKQTDPNEIKKEIDKIEEAFEQQATELAQGLKLSLGLVEFSLLITGTFLWGFGDLLVEYVMMEPNLRSR